MKKRIIAIHLPQFHPFKENNEWWGEGFTEWTNVTKARPRFRGHYQPHLPSDTGFYDLRLPEARQMQADMAKKYGLYGFCYYHYWFNGHRLMERPVNEILATGKPDFPFMLCWANENWARNWDGGFKNILMEQRYSKEDDIAHMTYLCKEVFPDNRYIKVNGKPFFLIYKSELFPNMRETIKTWRQVAGEYGFELYLGFMENPRIDVANTLALGFDVTVDFQPTNMGTFLKHKNTWKKILNKITHKQYSLILDYGDYVDYQCGKAMPQHKQFPCVSPGWDNSSRRVGKPFIAFVKSTPQKFGKWLKETIKKFHPYSKEENFIFVNAWNEWAEGNHLEPDQRWGRAYLEETKQTIDLYNK